MNDSHRSNSSHSCEDNINGGYGSGYQDSVNRKGSMIDGNRMVFNTDVKQDVAR